VTLARQIRLYFGVNAIFTLGRVVPQATLTPILVDKGLTYSDILATQFVYMVVLFAAEFPAGVLADRFSRKYLYLLAVLSTGLAYVIVWQGSGVTTMLFAWAVYALGSAFLSNTMDVHFAVCLRHDDTRFRRFFTTDRNVVLVASIVAACISSFVYGQLGINLYWISIGAFAVAIVAGGAVLPGGRRGVSPSGGERLPLRHVMRSESAILRVVLLFGLAQLAFTPFFQLWQMVALSAGVPASLFGLLFVSFQVLNVAANLLLRHLPRRTSITVAILAFMSGLGCVGFLVSGVGAVVITIVIPLPLFLYSSQLEYTLQTLVPARTMSSFGSLMGTASTIVAMICLLASLLAARFVQPSTILFGSLLLFGLLSLALLWWAQRRPTVQVVVAGA
jgi:MFS family permease